MSKDTFYFSHDANARNDEKILMLRMEHGPAGYGLYWILVEMMFESSDTALSHNKIKAIAFANNTDITLLQDVINTCIEENLFVSDGEQFWSESLRKRKNIFTDAKRKKSEAGKKGMEARWAKKKATEEQQNNNTVIDSDNTVITNVPDVITSKVNESKVNESKGKEREEGQNLPPAPPALNDLAKIARTYEQKISFNLNQFTHDDFTYWLDTYKNVDLILYAIERTAEKPEFPNGQAKPPKLIEHMLKSWSIGNLRTVDEARAYEERNTKKPVTSGSKRNALK